MLDRTAESRPNLDRQTIVLAALQLLDEVGLEGLSTRRLAAELGVKGPSLYWHFKNKGELLADMSAVLFAEALPNAEFGPDFDWEDWLARGARGLRNVALSRRDGALVMARARPAVNDQSRAFEEMTRCLTQCGLSESDSALTLLALGRFAMGWVLYEQAAARRTIAGGDTGFEHGLETFLMGVRVRVERAQEKAAKGG